MESSIDKKTSRKKPNMERIKEIAFIEESLKKSFIELKEGKFEERKLFEFISRAIEDLRKNPFCGTRIQNKLIPKEYIQKYEIDNLWKYDLPNAWRLLYTVAGNNIKIISIILSWMTHKDYEKLFGY
jgi:Txe/YoeB family toxin of Txe-Axe toxin-antitoxin module